MGIEGQTQLHQEESKRQIHSVEHNITGLWQRFSLWPDISQDPGTNLFQLGLDLGPYPVLGLPNPVLTKNPAKASPGSWYLIKFLIYYPWCLCSWPVFSKNPLPLMSLLSTFPSSDPLILLFDCKSPLVFVAFGVENDLAPQLQQSWLKSSLLFGNNFLIPRQLKKLMSLKR